jgi:tetratricopeptide (TPR) repeat protein
MFRWRLGSGALSTRDIWRKGEKLIRKGKTLDAEVSLLQAAQSSSPIDRHYAYVKLIRLYQKMILAGEERLQELTEICRQDIALFPEFYEAWMVEYLNNIPTPYFPSFSVLANILEEQGNIEEAITICELAIGYELQETIGEDYPITLERLYQKRTSFK